MKQDESIELFPKKLKRTETLTRPAEIYYPRLQILF